MRLKQCLIIFLWLFIGWSALAAEPPQRPVRMLMMLNEGFWAPEYYLPRQLFDEAGFTVTLAARHPGLIYPDPRNPEDPVNVDISFAEVQVNDYDAIMFTGGNGAWTDYFPNDRVHQILKDFLTAQKPTGLLCASTGLLGVAFNYNGQNQPLAKARHVTGYYRVEGLLRELGQVNYDAGDPQLPYVVVDGNLITGRDPMSAQLFGETLVRILSAQR